MKTGEGKKMKKTIAILSFFICLIGTSQASLVQWNVEDGGNGHWYEAVYVSEGISWNDAESASISNGGHLATLTSAEENAFVFSLVQADHFWTGDSVEDVVYGPWLGGYQEDGWKWVTAESFEFQSWFPGEPSNTNGIEGRLHYIYRDWSTVGLWNDWPASGHQNDNIDRINGYVIEYIPEPCSLSILALGLLALKKRKS